MRFRAAVVAVCASGIFAVAAAPAPAATPLEPVAAAVCLTSPGSDSVLRADGSPFTSGAECIAYAARGGTLIFANASCTLGLGAQARNQLIWTCAPTGQTLIARLVSIAILSAYCNLLDGRFTVGGNGIAVVASSYRV